METTRLDLPIRGITCASCVARIEQGLSAVPGVLRASVNLATEKAAIEASPAIRMEDLTRAVEAIGYTATPAEAASVDHEKAAREQEIRRLGRQALVGALLSLPLMLGSFPTWFPWLPRVLTEHIVLFLLATPVHFWVGWQFHRGFWAALRHRTADMNTLVSVGTSAGYLYSVLITFVPGWFAAEGLGTGVYFETVAVLHTLIILGRYLEARARGRTSEAIKKLMGLQARTARVVRNAQEVDIAVEDVQVGDLVVVRPGEKLPVDGIVRLVSFGLWMLWGPTPALLFALSNFMAVLLIACPCAIGLAAPTAVMVGIGKGAEHGILFRGAEALEFAARLSTVVLDKTGTLTKGEPEVTDLVPVNGFPARDLLRFAASAEQGSEHPLGEAIVKRAQAVGVTFARPETFLAVPGHGIRARVDKYQVLLGNLKFMRDAGIELNGLDKEAEHLADEGKTPMFVAVAGRAAGLIAVADTLKPHARAAVAAGVLYPIAGLLLNPMLAGAAMAFSSVSVVTNSLRLRRFRPQIVEE